LSVVKSTHPVAWLGDTAMRFISVGVDTTANYGTAIWYFPTCKLHTKAWH